MCFILCLVDKYCRVRACQIKKVEKKVKKKTVKKKKKKTTSPSAVVLSVFCQPEAMGNKQLMRQQFCLNDFIMLNFAWKIVSPQIGTSGISGSQVALVLVSRAESQKVDTFWKFLSF